MGRKIIIFLAVLGFVGCGSVKTVTVEKVRTQYVSKTDTLHQHDSVWVHDSVYFAKLGDTIYKEKWRTVYKDHYIYKVREDTVCKTDTIQKYVQVEKKEGWFTKLQKGVFWWLVVALAGMAFALYLKKKT